MSKIIFEPKAKQVTVGESFEPKEDVQPNSSYKSFGASKWKSLTTPVGDVMGGLADAATALGDSLAPAIANGPIGEPTQMYAPVTKYGLRIQKPLKDEYLKHFKPVDLPPSAISVAALFPEDKIERADKITTAKAYYNDFLNMCNDRKKNVEKILKVGHASPKEVDIMKQFLSKLDEAIDFTNKQVAALDSLDKE